MTNIEVEWVAASKPQALGMVSTEYDIQHTKYDML